MINLARQLRSYYEAYEKITSSPSLRQILDIFLEHGVELPGEGVESILSRLAELKPSYENFSLIFRREGQVDDIEVELGELSLKISREALDNLDGYEYNALLEQYNDLKGVIGRDAFEITDKNGLETSVAHWHELYDFLLRQGRKGADIQRYKGLGEMNPDQLWDTTVNPETRRLMQVKIDDAVKADEIFTTLMGDQVEPRREFIEKNALMVSNLDV